jgi:methionyl aminopeptidase
VIVLKSVVEIAQIEENGSLLAEVLELLAAAVRPGVTTADLDRIAESAIRTRGGTPSFKGYNGFPASICTSINDEVVHGIPSPLRSLEAGDIVSLDVGFFRGGYHADAARTFPVGGVDETARRLLQVTEGCLEHGIAEVSPGHTLGDLGYAIQSHAEAAGFHVVRELVGHGIGERLHEDPQVPNYGVRGEGLRLRPGMVLAIEPMVNVGTSQIETLEDAWTIRTADGSLSAHFEHTVAVTADGCRVLTAGAGGVAAPLPRLPGARQASVA